MKNDITRDTFDPLKHFSRVLMQQGRVQLDADWNEQVSILLHYLRTVTADLIGPPAGPASRCGFELIVAPAQLDAVIAELGEKLTADELARLKALLTDKDALIAPGRYYIDGLLAENEQFLSFTGQPGWAPREQRDDIQKGMKALVYLDLWEQHVTPIEDDSIREKALGGPDTTTRARMAWAVRTRKLLSTEVVPAATPPASMPPGDVENLRKAFSNWAKAEMDHRGLLRAGIAKPELAEPLCGVSPELAYRGVENQLYRVEVHRAGLAADGKSEPATFKWSRDNGSVVTSWLETDGAVLRVNPLRDQQRGFSRQQWVELQDDRREAEGRRGTLVQLANVEAGSLTIDPATASGSLDRTQFVLNPKVRRWDHAETEAVKLHHGAIPIQEGKWLPLENGVQIQFQASTGEPHRYRTGDYWLIPARVAMNDVEWPQEKSDKGEFVPMALPPRGVTHRYALLGVLTATGGAFSFTDCRRKFSPVESL